MAALCIRIRSISPALQDGAAIRRSSTAAAPSRLFLEESSIMHTIRLAATVAFAALASTAIAAEIRVQCYSDGNECEVTGDLAKRFEARNPGIKVVIDKVPYKAVVETLPVQLAAVKGRTLRASPISAASTSSIST
jgi:hypothetical protein